VENQSSRLELSVAALLTYVGGAALVLGIGTVLFATLAYLPDHPGFSIFTTYLSDIGDSAGPPQILFNAGTLVAAPVRYLFLALVLLRLFELGAPRGPVIGGAVVGVISTTGTIMMTAAPYSVAPAVHKSGIGLYFLGVVILQTLFIIAELKAAGVPKSLPLLSAAMIGVYTLFTALVVLYGVGSVGRSTPVFWEWMCFFVSMAWLVAHIAALGRVRWIRPRRIGGLTHAQGR
jgi:hypothetical protein